MVVIYALANAFAVACSNLMGGAASRRLFLPQVLLLSSPAALAVALILAAVGQPPAGPSGILIGAIAGILGGLGLAVAYRALAIGPVGEASAVIACTSTVVITFSGLARGDHLTLSRTAAIALCIAAVVLVSLKPNDSPENGPSRYFGLMLGVCAGAGFAAFALVMKAVSADDGWWPLAGARIGVVMVSGALVTILVVRSGPKSLQGALTVRIAPLSLGAGALDVTGNVFLVLALRSGDLLEVAVISSSAPALTASLGWLLLGERLRPLQVVGLIIAACAITLGAL